MKYKNRIYIGLFCLVACGITLFFGLKKRYSLERDHELTSGVIYDFENGIRGSGYSIHYTYAINGVIFKESSIYTNSDIPFSIGREYFIGKRFPIVYNPKNPSNSSIMIVPERFNRFGYSFPDSLKWILSFVKKQ